MTDATGRADAQADVEALAYDEAFAELQRVVAALETGGLSLEATIALYERAVALQRRCERLLARRSSASSSCSPGPAASSPPSTSSRGRRGGLTDRGRARPSRQSCYHPIAHNRPTTRQATASASSSPARASQRTPGRTRSPEPVPILDRLQGPPTSVASPSAELEQLAAELRETIIRTVAATGRPPRHLAGRRRAHGRAPPAARSPRDRIVWDTGHQAYAHKLLTGRLDRFHTLRQIGGVGGFPRRTESEHDVLDGGHAGTGLSIAEGLATARDVRDGLERIAVVVGDAALMTGLCLEALNDIGQRQTRC